MLIDLAVKKCMTVFGFFFETLVVFHAPLAGEQTTFVMPNELRCTVESNAF